MELMPANTTPPSGTDGRGEPPAGHQHHVGADADQLGALGVAGHGVHGQTELGLVEQQEQQAGEHQHEQEARRWTAILMAAPKIVDEVVGLVREQARERLLRAADAAVRAAAGPPDRTVEPVEELEQPERDDEHRERRLLRDRPHERDLGDGAEHEADDHADEQRDADRRCPTRRTGTRRTCRTAPSRPGRS